MSPKSEAKKKLILKAVIDYSKTSGTYPTIYELQQITGIRSFDSIDRHIILLQKEGRLVKDHNGTVRLNP